MSSMSTPQPERGSELDPQSTAPGGDSVQPGGPAPGSSPEPAAGGKPAKADDPLRGSRSSAIYAGVIALAVVLVLLIIFIAQNTGRASVSFLGWEGSAPQAVLLLIATAVGLFLAGGAASLRIIQLRRRVKKDRKR